MSKSLTTKNVAAVVLGLGLILGLSFAFATPAKAQSVADIQAQINALLAQIAALQGGTFGGACFTFTQNLTIGSTGNEVMQAQKFLNAHGALVSSVGAGSPGNETAYFGARTQAAVSAFQAANGIAPAAGYWGPITRSRANSMCVVVAPPPGPPGPPGAPGAPGGPLQGGAGSINDVDYVSGLNNEEVGEDSEDVDVAGLVIEADDGSDIELTAVNLNFSPGTGVGSNDFDEYATEVSISLDGKELARVDASDFESDQNFDRTISLDASGIIRAGDTGDLVVAVTAIGNLDSADATDIWNLEFESVRFRDAQGASVTDSATGDINDATGRNFSFDTFATANDVELKATACDDTPEGVVNIDDANDTDGVELLCFTLEAEGGDIHLEDLPINFATSSGNTAGNADQTLADIATSLTVTIGGDEWSEDSSAAVQGTAGATVTFDDFDYDLDEGDEVEVVVSADIQDTTAAVFTDGDALTAGFTASNRNVLSAEDESGEDLAAGDRTGTGLGEALAFYDIGIMVTFVSAEEELTSDATTANTDTGSFEIVFSVEAFDGTIYVADVSDSTTDATTGNTNIDETLYRLMLSGTATVAGLSDGISYTTTGGASDSTNGNIQLEDGESTNITLLVSRTNTAANPGGIMQLFLQAIAWDTVDNTYADGTDAYNVFDFDLEDFKTDQFSLN